MIKLRKKAAFWDVALYYVSVEYVTSIFQVERILERGTALAAGWH
jgi:hypothetical protein